MRGSKGQEQSIANRLQQTAATSGCSSLAPCYLARMQAHHYHIFDFFFKRSQKPGSFKAFPSVWISMMTNWMFSKYCMLPAREWLPALHTVFLPTETSWSCGGPLLPAPHPRLCQNHRTRSSALLVARGSIQPASPLNILHCAVFHPEDFI